MTEIPTIAASYRKIADKCPQLSDAEESSLLSIRDEAAKEWLFRHNIKLAIAYMLKCRPSDMSVEDAIQLAMCGLLKAIDKFDTSIGTRFSTYACYWIRNEITYHTRLAGYARIDKCCKSMSERVGDGDIMLEEVVNGLVARDYECHASNLGMDEWTVSGICDIVFGCLDSLTCIRSESKRVVRHVLMELRDPCVQIMEAYCRVAKKFGISERQVRYLSGNAFRALRKRLLIRFGREEEVSEVGGNMCRRRFVNTRTLTTRVDWERFSLRPMSKRRKLVSFFKDERWNNYILGVVASERLGLRHAKEQKGARDELVGNGAAVAIAREMFRERLDEVENQWASMEENK